MTKPGEVSNTLLLNTLKHTSKETGLELDLIPHDTRRNRWQLCQVTRSAPEYEDLGNGNTVKVPSKIISIDRALTEWFDKGQLFDIMQSIQNTVRCMERAGLVSRKSEVEA